MNLDQNDKIQKAKFLNDVISQKTVGVYNRLSHLSNLSEREKQIKKSVEKIYLLHTSQRSDFKKLDFQLDKPSKSNNRKYLIPAILFLLVVVQLTVAFIFFLGQRTEEVTTENTDSILSLAEGQIYTPEINPKSIEVNIISNYLNDTQLEPQIEELENFGFVNINVVAEEAYIKTCNIIAPIGISRSALYTIQKSFAKFCPGLDQIEKVPNKTDLDIIIIPNED